MYVCLFIVLTLQAVINRRIFVGVFRACVASSAMKQRLNFIAVLEKVARKQESDCTRSCFNDAVANGLGFIATSCTAGWLLFGAEKRFGEPCRERRGECEDHIAIQPVFAMHSHEQVFKGCTVSYSHNVHIVRRLLAVYKFNVFIRLNGWICLRGVLGWAGSQSVFERTIFFNLCNFVSIYKFEPSVSNRIHRIKRFRATCLAITRMCTITKLWRNCAHRGSTGPAEHFVRTTELPIWPPLSACVRNLSPFWAGTLSVATWYDSAWIGGTASG